MIKADIHTHTTYSTDCEAPMETMIREAISRGLDTLCFTEHMDKDYPVYPDRDPSLPVEFLLDTDAYRQCFLEMKEKYSDKIRLLWGVEIGLQPNLAEWNRSYVNQHPFDFVIGSEHNPENRDPYYPAFFEGRSEQESYSLYFRETLTNLKLFTDFDSLGHMDYIVRYGPNKNADYSYKKYAEYIEPILEFIVKKGIALEINSKGYSAGLGQPNPCKDIIVRYKELGGDIITIGSDAHTPQSMCFEFERVEALLLECGFRQYAVFSERHPEFYPLG
ncbi:MAG: histidinol-phosphatase HisJ family protein [Lachnospiraceae bacterium]|nr:histidinol-phosphatase HisJ family protein [Lachnospiraceae bacterium]